MNKVDSTDEVVVIRSKVIEDNIQSKIDKICETWGDEFPSDEDLVKHVELKHVNKIEKRWNIDVKNAISSVSQV